MPSEEALTHAKIGETKLDKLFRLWRNMNDGGFAFNENCPVFLIAAPGKLISFNQGHFKPDGSGNKWSKPDLVSMIAQAARV